MRMPKQYDSILSSSSSSKQTSCNNARHCRRLLQLQQAATTAAEDDHDDNHHGKPPVIRYRWTRPTLDLAVPALIGMMADPLLSLMDTAFVGRLGAIELASLGACTSIFHLAFNAFRATTTATTSLVSSALQDNPDEAKEVTRLSLSLGIVIGLTVLVVLRSSGTWCLQTMGIAQSSALFEPAHAYLNTRLWAAPAVLAIVVAEGAFRGYANTKIPLLASLVAAIINLILDPILMFPLGLGVMGAAAATAISQFGAAAVHAYFLKQMQMLPSSSLSSLTNTRSSTHGHSEDDDDGAADDMRKTETAGATEETSSSLLNRRRFAVIRTILGANCAMFAKQGSLLLAWAYATSKATRLGAKHVAAHQVALSFWLVFALLLDGAAVSAQVLMSRAIGGEQQQQQRRGGARDASSDVGVTQGQQLKDADDDDGSACGQEVQSLSRYMIKFGIGQGLVSTLLIAGFGSFVPQLFTTDPTIQYYLHQLMPHLAAQQVLISLTLIMESMAAGANQFTLLAVGTTLSTLLAVGNLKNATNVVSIWSRGIVTLFVGRCLTATIGVAKLNVQARQHGGRGRSGESGGLLQPRTRQ